MRSNKFRKKFYKALDRLIKKDGDLIKYGLNERSICHRFGVYLYETFRDYDVDCEYNGFERSRDNRKIIKVLRTRIVELNRLRDRDSDDELLERKVYPDIIIHKRGTPENLLIIEGKKSTNRNRLEIQFDKEKLSRFTSGDLENHLNYKYGLYINFVVNAEPNYELTWYQNGNQISEADLWPQLTTPNVAEVN